MADPYQSRVGKIVLSLLVLLLVGFGVWGFFNSLGMEFR